ncbi:hypothetical protein [Methylobacterium sp. UNC378MF]|uniref:hypothetical protein n=1 Tax=Methylobacterium sp. UNC378MF TaxID=1502748 RepID=UPI001FCCE50D|nr:hypothetical protein [Methylobacterium sp. UNC378MF]
MTGLVGVSAAVIGFQPRVIPSPVSQAQTLNAALQPVFEGVWDPLKPSQLLAPSR